MAIPQFMEYLSFDSDVVAGDEQVIGKTVSHYRIRAKLGEGGMGEVYLAVDPTDETRVAIKFLAADRNNDPTDKQRFIHEAKAQSMLHHPNLTAYLESGEHEGRAYIVMEYVDGRPLNDYMAEMRPSLGEIVDLLKQIADGLAAAHEGGVIHRDIKPQNILVTSSGQPKITDFGLARWRDATTLTKTGTQMGTAYYMSPEQVDGRRVDHRSDIFSLGVLAYELICSRRPFEGESTAAITYSTVWETPHPLARYTANVPDELQQIIDRCLEKNPNKRYQSARELAADLERVARGVDSGSATGHGARRFRRRRLIGKVAIGLAGVVAVAAAVSAILIFRPASVGTISVAVLPLAMTGAGIEEHAWLAEGIGQSIANRLTKLGGVRVTPWVTSQRYSDNSVPAKDVATELGVERLIVGTIGVVNDRMRASVQLVDPTANEQLWSDEYEQKITDVFDLMTEIALGSGEGLKGSLSSEEERLLAKSPSKATSAYELYIKGSAVIQSESPEDKDIALTYFERAIQSDPEFADAYVGRGAVYYNRFFRGWAGKESFDAAERDFRRALDLDSTSVDATKGLLTLYGVEQGRSEETLKLGAAIQRPDDEDPGRIFARASSFFLAGLPDKAIPLYESILQLDPANKGALWHLVVASCWAYQSEKAIDAAEKYFERFGEDPELHLWVGVSHQILGDLDAAKVHLERSLELIGAVPPDNSILFLGNIYALAGDTAASVAFWQKAAAELSLILRTHPTNFRVAQVLACTYALLGQYDAAEKTLNQAFDTSPAIGDIALPSVLLVKSGRRGAALRAREAMLTYRTNDLVHLRRYQSMGLLRMDESINVKLSEDDQEGLLEMLVKIDTELRTRY